MKKTKPALNSDSVNITTSNINELNSNPPSNKNR